MKLFKSRAEPEMEKAEQPAGGDTLLRAFLTNETIGKEQAMDIPAFAACVNKIAETISTIPIKLYKRDGSSVTEVADYRTGLLNKDTGDTMNGVEFKRAIVKDYLTGKGGYAYINKKGKRILSVHYVKEQDISFMYNTDPIFKDYDIMVQGGRYKPYQFLKVLRNTDNGWAGKSVVEENNRLLSVAYNSLKYEENLVKTGGNKKGFIKSPKKLAKTAIDALKEAWRRLYQNNDENVVILNEGLEFQESSNTSVEMQLNENKKTNSDEICKIVQMPPSMVKGGTSEQDVADYVQYCINPILNEFTCSLDRDFLYENEKDTLFFAADTSELTKGDIEKRFNAYATASQNGFMQIDEIRYRENMAPLGLDFVRLGLQDVLYDVNTKQFYIPNMNAKGGLSEKAGNKINAELQKEGENIEDRIKE